MQENPEIKDNLEEIEAEEFELSEETEQPETVPAEELAPEEAAEPIEETAPEEAAEPVTEEEKEPVTEEAEPAEEPVQEEIKQPEESTEPEQPEEPAPSEEAAPAEEAKPVTEEVPTEDDGRPVRTKPRKLVAALIILLILVVAAGAAATVIYFQGREYFRTHFAFNTTVNGEDVSLKEMQPVLAAVKEKYPTTFTIKEKNNVEKTIDFSGAIENKDIDQFIEEQSAKAVYWYESYKKETSFTSSSHIEINEDSFKAMAKEALNSVERTPSKDAYIDIKKMEIVPEEIGNELDVDKIVEEAYKQADENNFELTVSEDEYFLPKVFRDDTSLTSVIDEYNTRINRTIQVDVTGTIHRYIEPDVVKDWISYDGKKFNVDRNKVLEYTQELEYDFNTAWSERDFVTSKGKTIQIGRGENDTYTGWLMNEEETCNNIMETLESETGEWSYVSWDIAGYTLDENADDIGGTYIEISIKDQHMWYYEDHKLKLETDVVTGLESDPKRRTPRGLFYLLQMSSPFVMHGDYGTQPCKFFIKVTWEGVAIHDADWQSAFGGDRYLTAGSHGCINTPYDKVSALWDYLDALDDWQVPVIIY